MKWFASALCALVLVCGVGAANAQVLYSTSFEPPTYTAGAGLSGVDGWANSTITAGTFSVSTDRASSGVQSIKSDNSGSFNSFYSIRHDLGGYTAASGLPLEVSVDVWIDPSSEVNRLYGLYLGSAATSSMAGNILGLTVDAAGNIRGGTTWSSTYTNTGLFGTADPQDVLGRWLTITLSYDPVTDSKKGTISGLGGATPTYSNSWTGGTAPVNVNIGTDYFASTNRAGIGYFDNLSVVVPEPASLALGGVLGLAALRRRR